jgi:ferredoxin
MIVAQRKPFEEIKKSLAHYQNILVAGCGTCVAVCLAGGKKEVGLLASQLRMSFGLDKKKVKITEVTLERQCDREFLETAKNEVEQAEAVLSLACGAGIQYLAEAAGLWTERCRACGECLLAETGGICPRTLCSKGLNNGPCGGMVDGKCEVDLQRPCAWVSIYDRLSREGRLVALEAVGPPTDYTRQTQPGKVTHAAYLRRVYADSK